MEVKASEVRVCVTAKNAFRKSVYFILLFTHIFLTFVVFLNITFRNTFVSVAARYQYPPPLKSLDVSQHGLFRKKLKNHDSHSLN
jgi:hypothetical protein